MHSDALEVEIDAVMMCHREIEAEDDDRWKTGFVSWTAPLAIPSPMLKIADRK